MNKIKNASKKFGMLIGLGIAAASQAVAQTTPTSLDGFQAKAEGYIGTGTTVAIAAAVLSLGWVGFRIVKKYTARAAS